MPLLGTIGALLITVILLPQLYSLWDYGHTQTQKRLAADHLKMVTLAASEYVRKHDETLRTSATASSGPSVGVPDLINDDLLRQGFSSRNVWGQTYQIYFRQPKTNELQAIVLTTGGRTDNPAKFETIIVPSAALLAGGSAGFVPNGDVPGQTADTLHGAGGGWVLSLGALGIPSPGPGHLGALGTFDDSALGQDFLYRVAVPGHPELNAMQTELDMTDHAIRGVSELQFTEREISTETCADDEQGRVFLDKYQGLFLCRNNRLEAIGDTGNSTLLREAALARNGDTVSKPVCPTNTGTTPMIFTAPSLAAFGPESPPISAFQTWAISLDDTQWQVFMRLLSADKSLSADDTGWVYPLDDFNRISVFTTCARVTP
ncbi:MAG: shufflon system plasmid conjugative transfer pilus tip adhesin PilV [Desulfovibrio sp.]|nr:shufflon system plasmid conjugative transfer pilus tip adhesin PilV [Desulfovibrio sp.]